MKRHLHFGFTQNMIPITSKNMATTITIAIRVVSSTDSLNALKKLIKAKFFFFFVIWSDFFTIKRQMKQNRGGYHDSDGYSDQNKLGSVIIAFKAICCGGGCCGGGRSGCCRSGCCSCLN